MDQPKIERVLRLMKMMAGNNNYTVEDMAERLGISYRSVYRYHIDTSVILTLCHIDTKTFYTHYN